MKNIKFIHKFLFGLALIGGGCLLTAFLVGHEEQRIQVGGYAVGAFLLFIVLIGFVVNEGDKNKETPSVDPVSTPMPTQLSFSPFFESEDLVKISVDNEKVTKKQIEFAKLEGIKTLIVADGSMVIFMKDYRTVRLTKEEVRPFYLALIESEYQYFKPGVHDIEIKITTKPTSAV